MDMGAYFLAMPKVESWYNEKCMLGEAILTILKVKITKIKKKLTTNTLEPPENISKEFELPACNQHFLGDLKLLKI